MTQKLIINYEFQRLDVLRRLLTSKKALNQFRRVEAGAQGEDRLNELLTEYGMNHWIISRNVWFNEFSDFECGFILLTGHAVYVFEVKNYFGQFVYKNGQCTSRGTEITYNPINQARNATIHLRNLTQKFDSLIPVKGMLVFIGEHNQVEIKDPIDYITIIRSNEISEYIQQIIDEEHRHPDHGVALKKLSNYYNHLEIPNPHGPKPFTLREMKAA